MKMLKINNNKSMLNKTMIFVLAFILTLTISGNINILKVSSVQAESLTINSLIKNNDINIFKDNKSMQEAFNRANNNLPLDIKEQLYDNHYSFRLTNNYIYRDGKEIKAQGICNYDKKMITVVHYSKPKNYKTNCILVTESDSIVLLHEIGHSVDTVNYKYTMNKEFINAYLNENDKLFNTKVFHNVDDSYLDYYRSQSQEYFAESFAVYFNSQESRNILKTHAPKTYTFIKNNIDK